jgi:hypothetical protein
LRIKNVKESGAGKKVLTDGCSNRVCEKITGFDMDRAWPS